MHANSRRHESRHTSVPLRLSLNSPPHDGEGQEGWLRTADHNLYRDATSLTLCPGYGEVDWSALNTVCASELLKFEEIAAAALQQASLEDLNPRSSFTSDASPSPLLSPRGGHLPR